MKIYQYTGTFVGSNGHRYELVVHCNGFLQALILLTADAIRSGKHWQLARIEHENGSVKLIGDILTISQLIK